MAQEKVFKGDVGTKIEFIFENLTDIISASIFYKKSNGETGEWTEVNIDEENNKIWYVNLEEDFDVTGSLELQPFLKFPEWSGRGEKVSLYVENRI